MNLNQRLKKIESLTAEMCKPAAVSEADRYKDYIWSHAFLNDAFIKACEIAETMTQEHRSVVLPEFLKIADWYHKGQEAQEQDVYDEWSSKWKNRYPETHILSRLFAEMVTGSIDGYYFGPLAIPAIVGKGWIDFAVSSCRCPYPEKGNCTKIASLHTQFTCEACGYYMPATKEPCAMCKGSVSSWGYEFCHGLPAAVPLYRRDEQQQVILTSRHTMWFLGLMVKHEDLTQ